MAAACATEKPPICSGNSSCDLAENALESLQVTVTNMSGTSVTMQMSPKDSLMEVKRWLSVRLNQPVWSFILVRDVDFLQDDSVLLGELCPAGEAGRNLDLSLVVSRQLPVDVEENTQAVLSIIHRCANNAMHKFYDRYASPWGRDSITSTYRSSATGTSAMFLPDSHTRAARKRRERLQLALRRGRRGLHPVSRVPRYAGPRVVEHCGPAQGKVSAQHTDYNIWTFRTGCESTLQQGMVDFARTSGGLLHYMLQKLRGPGLLRGFELMLDGGAAVGTLDKAGRTPLHVAAQLGRGLVAELLLRRRGELALRELVLRRASDGRTALEMASAHLLRRHPADVRGEEDFALARVCCDLAAVEAQHMVPGVLEGLRARLAQAATHLSLLRRPCAQPITRKEVLRQAGLVLADLHLHSEADLWEGWPWAFLSFNTPGVAVATAVTVSTGPVGALRRLLVADMLEENKNNRWFADRDRVPAIVRSYSELMGSDCDSVVFHQEPPVTDDFVADFEENKARNKKWERLFFSSRRTTRVPWAAAPGGRLSRSSRMARRLPNGRPDCWGRRCGRKGEEPLSAQCVDEYES